MHRDVYQESQKEFNTIKNLKQEIETSPFHPDEENYSDTSQDMIMLLLWTKQMKTPKDNSHHMTQQSRKASGIRDSDEQAGKFYPAGTSIRDVCLLVFNTCPQ